MRNYELMILLDPSLQEEEISAMTKKVQQSITNNQGKIFRTNQWGKRKLAYEIKKKTEAIYVVFDFELEPENIANIEKNIKYEEKIIRYLIVLGQEKVLSAKDQNK
ncbi:MAG: 30S ribosomal protein S6 [Atribacterota bacterium]|nr:30S ribosomal protein S6 [Atribacterota bacterium]